MEIPSREESGRWDIEVLLMQDTPVVVETLDENCRKNALERNFTTSPLPYAFPQSLTTEHC